MPNRYSTAANAMQSSPAPLVSITDDQIKRMAALVAACVDAKRTRELIEAHDERALRIRDRLCSELHDKQTLINQLLAELDPLDPEKPPDLSAPPRRLLSALLAGRTPARPDAETLDELPGEETRQ